MERALKNGERIPSWVVARRLDTVTYERWVRPGPLRRLWMRLRGQL